MQQGARRGGRLRGRSGPRTRTKRPRPAVPLPPTAPKRSPPPPQARAARPGPQTATGSSGRTRSSRTAASSAPSLPVAERKKERGRRRRTAPTHHDPRRGDPSVRRCAVQGSRRPSASRRRRARSSYPNPRPARARQPALPRPLGLAPLPLGAPSRRAVLGARRSPPPPLARAPPAAALAGRRERGGQMRRRPRTASHAAPGSPCSPAPLRAPSAGRAAICRPSWRPRRSAAERSRSLGKDPFVTRHCPPPPEAATAAELGEWGCRGPGHRPSLSWLRGFQA